MLVPDDPELLELLDDVLDLSELDLSELDELLDESEEVVLLVLSAAALESFLDSDGTAPARLSVR